MLLPVDSIECSIQQIRLRGHQNLGDLGVGALYFPAVLCQARPNLDAFSGMDFDQTVHIACDNEKCGFRIHRGGPVLTQDSQDAKAHLGQIRLERLLAYERRPRQDHDLGQVVLNCKLPCLLNVCGKEAPAQQHEIRYARAGDNQADRRDFEQAQGLHLFLSDKTAHG